MPYNTITLQLTDDQLLALDAAVPNDDDSFGILAQPYIKGSKRGELKIYLLTPEQYRTIQPAIMHARSLSAFEPTR